MVDDLRRDGEKLKTHNQILLKQRNQLVSEDETLDIRLKSILK
jgi:hypothetical protein